MSDLAIKLVDAVNDYFALKHGWPTILIVHPETWNDYIDNSSIDPDSRDDWKKEKIELKFNVSAAKLSILRCVDMEKDKVVVC